MISPEMIVREQKFPRTIISVEIIVRANIEAMFVSVTRA